MYRLAFTPALVPLRASIIRSLPHLYLHLKVHHPGLIQLRAINRAWYAFILSLLPKLAHLQIYIQGTIVGAVLGVIAFLVIIPFLALRRLRRNRLNRLHQDGTTSTVPPFAETLLNRHPTLTAYTLTDTVNGRANHGLAPDGRKRTRVPSSVPEFITAITEASFNNSNSSLTNVGRSPIADATATTTNMPVNAVPNQSPRHGNSTNNDLMTAVHNLQERVTQLENRIPATRKPYPRSPMSSENVLGDGTMGGDSDRRDHFHERQREDPPTYVA
jgi:hypothetical protein